MSSQCHGENSGDQWGLTRFGGARPRHLRFSAKPLGIGMDPFMCVSYMMDGTWVAWLGVPPTSIDETNLKVYIYILKYIYNIY